MQLYETTKTAIFGIAVICFMVVNAKTTIFMTEKNAHITQYYDAVSLTVVVTGLFVNFWIGFFGLFIIMAFNNFLTRNLANVIGAYEKIKIVAGLTLVNATAMAFVNISSFFNVRINQINKELVYWFLAVFLSQAFFLYSCWLVHPDIFNKKFKKFKDKVIAERINKRTMYV
ncbi:hypothetical protein EHP00_1124 [Ecytonucleospora hepatopenaei]|uniref:Uncharacterized protein n=1 Tax=Ecytonucleospora hepatopenaei TaxID=646526 RepID=A0A1W0E519_9MICR|nr:hypothetical protein EHP00_1124 [Ecytonucleospora hepatopenaei]